MTLDEASALVDEHLQPGMPGVECPCCTQWCWAAHRKLNSNMAVKIAALYAHERRHPGAFMSYRAIERHGRGRDYHNLAFWGLIEPEPEVRGYWRITEKGCQFVAHGLRVPKAIYTFNKQCLKMTKGTTTMRIALRNKFDLDEFLRGLG